MTSTIEDFSDSDWGRDPDKRRSVSGYLMFLNGSLISWGSRRQQSVALSSMEAEYMALCLATQEAVWLIEIMKNLKFIQHSHNICCFMKVKNWKEGRDSYGRFTVSLYVSILVRES